MKSIKYCFIIVSILLIFAPIVLSQDKDKEKEKEENDSMNVETQEVVITGTRTLKKIIDIPYSVFSVEKKEMVYGRDLNAKDVLQDVPGLFLQTRFGSDVRISIRGFGTRSNSGVRGIRILHDGIPESDPDGESSLDAIDFTSLGGVEVVKGNQSSLYTNAPGGVVNFLSDLSFKNNFVKLTSQVGEYNLRQTGAKVGIIDKNYRFFTSYSYKNLTGFRQHSGEFSNLINSYYQAYLGNRTSVTILGSFVKSFVRLPGALTQEQMEQDPSQAYDYAVSYDLKKITSKGRLGVKISNTFGKKNEFLVEYTGFGALNDMEYTDIGSYNKKLKYILGSMARFVSKAPALGRENEFTCGIDYFYVTGPLSSYNNINGTKGDEPLFQRIETQGNLGGYFQNQLNILKQKLYFLVSGRYDKVLFNTTDEFVGFKSSNRQFDKFTPKAALNYKITPTVSLYTSYGFGFDTPSSTELENYPYSSNNGVSTLNPDIKPQTSRNYELGIKGNIMNKEKSEFMKKAYFEFTFFNTRINDEIIPVTLTNSTYYRNAAQTNRTGLECGLKFVPFEETDVTINYTYTHFRYSSYTARTYDAVGNPTDADYTNNVVPAVPEHLANFILEKELEISDHITGILQFDCDYVSKMFVDDENTQRTGDYFFANSMIGADFTFDKVNFLFAIGLNNFLNRKYVGYININSYPRFYEPGDPRTYYANLNLSYRF